MIDGWNAERILLAAEAIGDGYWFTERATAYANSREVFGRPIGANQGVQFPIAHAYMQVRAADLMRYEAARRFDAGEPCGAEANMAKLLSGEASWAAANVCLDTHGGYGFVDDLRRRAQVPRDPPLQGRAGQQQPRHELHRDQGAGAAAVLLSFSGITCGFPAPGRRSFRRLGRPRGARVVADTNHRSREGVSVMRKLFQYAGIAASIVLIAFGVAPSTWASMPRPRPRQPRRGEDRLHRGLTIPGQLVDTGAEAQAFAKVMREHTLESTGGKMDSEMGRFSTPTARTRMTRRLLRRRSTASR